MMHLSVDVYLVHDATSRTDAGHAPHLHHARTTDALDHAWAGTGTGARVVGGGRGLHQRLGPRGGRRGVGAAVTIVMMSPAVQLLAV